EDVPMTLGLVVDSSESMRAKSTEVRAVAMNLAESSNASDEIFVVTFNGRVCLSLPPNIPFTNNVEQLEAALHKSAPEGETALYDAILLAMKHLELSTRERKSILLISDGDDNASRISAHQVLAAAKRNFAPIYVLGIQHDGYFDTNATFLNQLAEVTGGRAHFIARRDPLSDIARQIARELREQYILVYSPSNGKCDEPFRTIRVVAQTPAQGTLLVRTRPGYQAQNG
ncbi:MAG: VWA domain-containing protein, partial [Candidatus Acidiferrum sp.]